MRWKESYKGGSVELKRIMKVSTVKISEKERKKRKEREDIERNKAYKKGLYRQE